MVAAQNPLSDAAWWIGLGGILFVAYLVAAVTGKSERLALAAGVTIWLGLSAAIAALPEIR